MVKLSMLNFIFSGLRYKKYQQFFEFNRKDYHFRVGVEDGKLLFDRKLLSFNGAHLPILMLLMNTLVGFLIILGFGKNEEKRN